ncbi:NUDIX hydrolase domain-like protein [Limtongia smithiae]|uniref:NUDIX hydrolase domain-like protein n=1 Tax=Limtongia smithiae TaxID=1125753 RepID=UPI0034D00E75
MSVTQALRRIATRADIQLATPLPDLPDNAASIHSTIRHASVAVVVRFRPRAGHEGLPSSSGPNTLEEVLQQDWIDGNDADVLLIKRTTRPSDRWSGHVALPGGRRDPDDVSDLAVAERETLEEVGLDLDQHAVYVGPLPRRYVTTHWGGNIFMILCTYVFVLKTPKPVDLVLQESEVALAFWVPLAELSRKSQQCEFVRPLMSSSLLALPWLLRPLVKSAVGELRFEGIRISSRYTYGDDDEDRHAPVIMWGLTHSIFTDLFDIMYPLKSGYRPRLPGASRLDTRIVTALLGKMYFERHAGRPQTSIWTRSRKSGALTGYVVDRYYHVFETAVIATLAIRTALGIAVVSAAYKNLVGGRR